jgi:hypothetical protein
MSEVRELIDAELDSEVRELIDAELDAVGGGWPGSFVGAGGFFGPGSPAIATNVAGPQTNESY